MRVAVPLGALSVVMLVLGTSVSTQDQDGLMADLVRDVGQVREKVVGLAKAMPKEAYDWRPGTGVRSTSEVLMHVAADNYFIPSSMGMSAPAETGVSGKDYDSAVAFEKKTMGRDEIIAELEKSFAFLEQSMKGFPESKLDAPLEVFGQKMTHRRMWIAATTHLHEHLGQLIAYARSNTITPPWSK